MLKEGIPAQKFSDMSNLRPGDIKYKDLNGDGEVTAVDKTAIGGTRIPEIVYGFGATVSYKSFDLGVFFQGTGKTYQLLGGETWLPGSSLGVLVTSIRTLTVGHPKIRGKMYSGPVWETRLWQTMNKLPHGGCVT